MKPPKDLANWLQKNLLNAVPMAVGVIDRQFDFVYANYSFEQMFGSWQGKKCHQVYKGQHERCDQCHGAAIFRDGKPAVNEEVGYNKEGRPTRYLKHTVPVTNDLGDVIYLLDMCIDITESERIRQEYQLLFDQVPCSVLVIDKRYRIAKTNERAHEMLGNLVGKHCYSGLKGRDKKCNECTARKTFEDGELHTGHHVWRTKKGDTIHLHVITVPLRGLNEAFDTVMEMAVDVTESMKLQDGLQFAHSFLETLVSTSLDGIVAVDVNNDVVICNPAARKFFAIRPDEKLQSQELRSMLPEGFLDSVIKGPQHVYIPDTIIIDAAGMQNPVRLYGHQLIIDGRYIGVAITIQDLSEIKRLEDEKLESERLAAVGQTVAGLAHGVKNLNTALKGGMYMLGSGLEKGNLTRIQKGMRMLERNTQRLSIFVKAFLNYAKGREIKAQLNDPIEIAKEVVEMYAQKAIDLNLKLDLEVSNPIPMAAIDYECIHECLTNLVGNAIDACRFKDNGGSRVILRAFEKNRVIFYEVIDDGCGIENDIKKKIFNTFFTTKGLSGTGLGLLMTRKMIQEHGGSIKLESIPNIGTTFRILLPRKHLPAIAETTASNPN